jgi:hypothetical protein
LVGYYLPTKIAGATNLGYALINFSSLAAYVSYREALMKDEQALANLADADQSGCILIEERTILRRVS